ncbi:MAG: hypothetical protein V4635_17105 [Bacteroidota bacterium]
MKPLVVLFFALTIGLPGNAKTLVIEGKYQNKNLYVQNSVASNGVGFCAREVKVNGRITTDETNSSSFEIDLASLQLKFGQKVVIEIVHGDGCVPKVLNMEDLKPKPTFEVLTMNISNTGLLKWNTTNETGSLPYIIEQFKWNKWIPVGEVQGIGTPDAHEYSFQLTMHSGENKYRVRQKGLNAVSRYSQEVIAKSLIDKPSFAISKNNHSVDFSAETGFEIYDIYGSVVKRGYGKQAKIDNLPKGSYYLCYDNTMTDIKK